MEIKPYEAKVLAVILELASDQFSHHSCINFDLAKLLSLEERQSLLKEMNEQNQSSEEYDPENCDFVSDWWLMSYFSDKFSKVAS